MGYIIEPGYESFETASKIVLDDEVQRKYHVAITGPSTLSAYLNALQMGFKTLAIQKRSSEVWEILGQAKAEFERYANWIEHLKRHLEQAHKTLDEAETRTRAVNRKLRNVAVKIDCCIRHMSHQ